MSKIQLGKGCRHSGLLLKFKIINLSCTDIVYMQWKKFPVFDPSSVWTKFLPDFWSFIHILDLLLSFLLSASLHLQESAGLLFMHWKRSVPLWRWLGKEGNHTVFTLSNPVSSDMKQTLCFQILTMAVFNEHSVLLEVSVLPTYYILIGISKLACSFFPIIFIFCVGCFMGIERLKVGHIVKNWNFTYKVSFKNILPNPSVVFFF